MGAWFAKLFRKNPARVVMIGLDAAGKTCLLYQMHLGETITTIPTIGFNTESVKAPGGLELTIFDIGGQDKIRQLWRHYYHGCDGIVWVLDANDPDRFEKAQEELFAMAQDEELNGVPLLVMANKVDLLKTVPKTFASDLAKQLGLTKMKTRKWYIQPSSAITREGIYPGFEWLSTEIRTRQKQSNV